MGKYNTRRIFRSAAKFGASYGVNKAVRMRYRQRGGHTRTGKKRVTSGKGVTGQFDKRTIYSKSYMPRYKKNRWRKFVNKVQAVSDKAVGTHTVVMNEQIQSTIGAEQSLAYAHLYSLKGLPIGTYANETGGNDITRIFSRDGLGDASKIHFISGVMDITFNGYPAEGQTFPMEVDVYEIVYRRGQYVGSLNDQVGGAESVAAPMTGYSTSLTMIQRGVTPFDLPGLGRVGLKIIKKTKYFLNENDSTFTYQIRDPKNRWITGSDFASEAANTEYAKGGWTRSLMFVIKLVPGFTPPPATIVRIGVTKKYAYKTTEKNVIQDGYLV